MTRKMRILTPIPSNLASDDCRQVISAPRKAGGDASAPRKAGGDASAPRKAGGDASAPRGIRCNIKVMI